MGGGCTGAKHFKLIYASELDSNWLKDVNIKTHYPELIPYVNQLKRSTALNAADCLAANNKLPLDKVYWNAGCHGNLYPLNGRTAAVADSVQASTLMAKRATVIVHRLRLLKDSGLHHLCKQHASVLLPKSRYRVQMVYPKRGPVQPIGRSTVRWAAGVVKPKSSEDYSFIIWQKQNCCLS